MFPIVCCSRSGFESSKEAAVIKRLLAAYRDGDEAAFREICRTEPLFTYIEYDVSVT